MSSDLGPLRKIFKDETNRKALFLLNEKGALTFDEFIAALDVTSGMFAYHLKVLNDFLEKTDEGKYVLSEKGKQAHELLAKIPENPGMSRRWKIGWCLSLVIALALTVVGWYTFDAPLTRVIPALGGVLFVAAIGYLLKVRPLTAGRVFYIGMGLSVLGCLFWLIALSFVKLIGIEWTLDQVSSLDVGANVFFITSLAVSYSAGGFVGDWIGKKRKYRIPQINF